MDIGDVVRAMKAEPAKRFARKGWNGKGMYIQLQVPDEHSKMTLPYVYMKTAQGDFVPWLCSQTDLVADDYYEVESADPQAIKIANMRFMEARDAVMKDPTQVYVKEGKADKYMFYNTEFGDILLKKGRRPLDMYDGKRLSEALYDGVLDAEDMSATGWAISGWHIYHSKKE